MTSGSRTHLFHGRSLNNRDRHPDRSRAAHHGFPCRTSRLLAYGGLAVCLRPAEAARLLTCLHGAGAGLARAAGCGRRDEPDVVEPASWNLDLLHVLLGGQRDDGLELGASDSSHCHGLDRFDALRGAGKTKGQSGSEEAAGGRCAPSSPELQAGWWPL